MHFFSFSNSKLIERYLFRQLLLSSLLVLAIILTIYSFINFFDEIENYDFLKALGITLLSCFDGVYVMTKPILLVGLMLGLSILRANHELVAMRSAGLRMKHIIKVMIQVAVCYSLLVYFLGEVVNPNAQKIIDELKQTKQIRLTNSGIWLKNKQGIVRIKQATNNGTFNELREVFIYQVNDHQLEQIKKISHAQIINNQWQLKQVKEQKYLYQGGSLTQILQTEKDETKEIDWLDESIFNQFETKIYTVSIFELYQRIQFFKENGINSNLYWLNFYKRIFTLLDAILIALFALALILFLPIRSQKASSRILLGLMIGLVLHLVSEIFSQGVLIYNLNPLMANLAMIIVLGFAIFFSYYIHKKQL